MNFISLGAYCLFVFSYYLLIKSQQIYFKPSSQFYSIWLYSPLGFDIAGYLFLNILGFFLIWHPLFMIFLLAMKLNPDTYSVEYQRALQDSFLKKKSFLWWCMWIITGIWGQLCYLIITILVLEHDFLINREQLVNTFFLLNLGIASFLFFYKVGRIIFFTHRNQHITPMNKFESLQPFLYAIFLSITWIFYYIVMEIYSFDNIRNSMSVYVLSIGISFFVLTFIMLLDSKITKYRLDHRKQSENTDQLISTKTSTPKIRNMANPIMTSRIRSANTASIDDWKTSSKMDYPKTCSKCGSDLVELYCTTCKQKICPVCISQNIPKAHICTCGYSFSNNEIYKEDRIDVLEEIQQRNQIDDDKENLDEELANGEGKPDHAKVILPTGLNTPPRICPYCNAVGWKEDICRCGYNYITKEYEPKNRDSRQKNL